MWTKITPQRSSLISSSRFHRTFSIQITKQTTTKVGRILQWISRQIQIIWQRMIWWKFLKCNSINSKSLKVHWQKSTSETIAIITTEPSANQSKISRLKSGDSLMFFPQVFSKTRKRSQESRKNHECMRSRICRPTWTSCNHQRAFIDKAPIN